MALERDDRDDDVPLPSGHASFAGKYKVERVLGQGGMGTVYEAVHIKLGQRVAIKVLGSALREYPELVARFDREARAAGALTSVHGVRIFDIDATDEGTPFIVMELLAGRDLAGIIDLEGPLPVGRAVSWVLQACEAIAEAHRLGIIHRDIKPSNLFLAENADHAPIVKVLDFGIAKREHAQEASITTAVAPLGTPQYMSPEQVRCAKDVDSRTDVWSLGVTIYELVTGQTPFPHESSTACIASIAADPVPDPRTVRADLDPAFVAVLMKALEKKPEDRFQSVDDLVIALTPFSLPRAAFESTSGIRPRIASEPKLNRDEVTLDAASLAPEEPAAATPPPILAAIREASDASDDVAAPAMPATPATPVFELSRMRPALVSDGDYVVPPTIGQRLAAAPKLRTRLAYAGAAVVGIAALFAIPQMFGANDAKAPLNNIAAAGIAAPVSTLVVAPPATVATPEPVADANEPTAPAPEPKAAAAPRSTVAIHAPATPPPAPPSLTSNLTPSNTPTSKPLVSDVGTKRPAPKASAERSKPEVAARSGVHGGLSNPGF